MLEIKNLTVSVEGKEIIKDLNIKLEPGKVHVLMGPNGSGKSTLANTLMGNPEYKIESGKIFFNNKEITNLPVNERAKLGFFMSFQYPQEVAGVTIRDFLKQAYQSLNPEKAEEFDYFEFEELLEKNLQSLNIDEEFVTRYLNQGFSGGEKKKSEILQLLTLNPKISILDETDSGLDIDSLRTIAKGIKNYMQQENGKDKICLVITHYKRILENLDPDKVYIMKNGKILLQGDKELVNKVEKEGYAGIS